MFYLKILHDSDYTDFLQKRFFNVETVELFLAFITLIELSLINIPATPLCAWIHFRHYCGHMTKTSEQNNINIC
jgi:hypothetical protein